MKKRTDVFLLFSVLFTCAACGFAACGEVDEDEAGRVNPRIIIQTDETDVALDIFEADYTIPFAGVYYENLDRVDGKEIRMSVKDPTGGYIYEDILDYRQIRFPMTGKYELIYKAEGCQDAVINIYVCDRLELEKEFTVEGNTLVWEEVYGAVGYEVTVNGSEPVFTETASFTSDVFAGQGYYVGVTAKGDNKEWLDSYMESYENRIPLEGGELAAFNNPCYELDIAPAFPDDLNAPPDQIKYLSQEECEGSTGGAVRFTLTSGVYGPALFRVKLQEEIDKDEEFDGMEVRFKLNSDSYIYNGESDATTRLILAQPTADERRVSRGTYVYECYNDSWQVMKVPKGVLDSHDGFKFLQFTLYNMVRSGGMGELYLDYIRLYKDEIATPTNVAVDGEKLVWDDVENAYEYMISVDKTDDARGALEQSYFYAKDSEIALSDLGIDSASETQQYEIKVMAVSADASIGSSVWSEKVVHRIAPENPDLAPMDNAIYVLDVNNALNFQHMYWKSYETVMGAEGGNAIRMTMNANDTYGTFSCFTVDLPKPLDLDGEYGCVTLRFKLEKTNYASLDTLSLQLVGKSASENYNAGAMFRRAITVGQWIDYQMSVADLKTYYQTGDTQLSFQITNTVANKSGGTVVLTAAIDYLRYFKTLDTPANVRVEGTSLKWDAVEGASGYTVSVNGTAHTGVTETSYDLTGLTDLNTLKVLAESVNPEKGSSAYSAGVYYQAVAENVLASFNNVQYAGLIGNVIGEKWSSFKETPVFGKDGAPEGTVTFALRWDDYRGGTSNWSNMAAFTVTLPKALDMDGSFAGIKVKLHVNEVEYATDEIQKVTFELLDGTKKTSWNATPGAPSVTIGDGVEATRGWIELKIKNAQLAEMGYKTGDTVLTFGLRASKSTQASVGAHFNVSIDYIEYATAEELDVRAKLAEKLAANELANFNDANYTELFGFIAGDTYKAFMENPSFEKPETPEGTVTVGIRNDDYRGGNSQWSNIAAFTIILPKALDFTKGDGVKIKLYVNKADQGGKLTLELLDDEKSTTWNATKSAVSVSIGAAGENTTGWMELFISNAQLAELGYKTGDGSLTFGLRNTSQASTVSMGYFWNISIDYIEYYSAAEMLVGGLQENELANFNNAAYVGSIGVVEGEKYNKFRKSPAYESDETLEGAVTFSVYNDDYRGGTSNWTKMAAFTVTLPKAINLESGYDGIKVRVYLTKGDDPGKVFFELLDDSKKTSWNDTASAVSAVIGENGQYAEGWIELTITNAQLAELGYKTGDTVLTFGVRTTVSHNADSGYYAILSMDSIKYYKENV